MYISLLERERERERERDVSLLLRERERERESLHFSLTGLVHETRSIAKACNGFHINLQIFKIREQKR